MYDIPILVLAFNRPAETQEVFERIRTIRPKYLFVCVDGARTDKAGEARQCKAVQNIFLQQTDWNCSLQTLFRERNLGCRASVSQAIDWFFGEVEYGIILEDDCVPELSFFAYCEELLKKYKDEHRIMQVAGYNPLPYALSLKESYFFSRQNMGIGWASWRRAWTSMDVDMKGFPAYFSDKKRPLYVNHKKADAYLMKKFKETYEKKNSSWGYAWAFSMFLNGGLSILPKVNLIKNIGIGDMATNTKNTVGYFLNTKTQEIDLPMNHPSVRVVDENRELDIFFHTQKTRKGLWVQTLFPEPVRKLGRKIQTVLKF